MTVVCPFEFFLLAIELSVLRLWLLNTFWYLQLIVIYERINNTDHTGFIFVWELQRELR